MQRSALRSLRRRWRRREQRIESRRQLSDCRRLRRRARPVKLAVEPLNRFETDLVNTVDQGVSLIEDIGVDNVGLLLDTFHMNIEEKDIPAAIGRAAGRIVEFHACSNDRGTPGEDHLPWGEIAEALKEARYEGPVVIEAFTPEIREIAKAVSIWRPLARSQDALARGRPEARTRDLRDIAAGEPRAAADATIDGDDYVSIVRSLGMSGLPVPRFLPRRSRRSAE